MMGTMFNQNPNMYYQMQGMNPLGFDQQMNNVGMGMGMMNPMMGGMPGMNPMMGMFGGINQQGF
jgi:hypothetical protein